MNSKELLKDQMNIRIEEISRAQRAAVMLPNGLFERLDLMLEDDAEIQFSESCGKVVLAIPWNAQAVELISEDLIKAGFRKISDNYREDLVTRFIDFRHPTGGDVNILVRPKFRGSICELVEIGVSTKGLYRVSCAEAQ